MKRLICILLWAVLPQGAAAEVACPEGTVLRQESSSAFGFTLCELRDGVYHGPAVISYPDGSRRMEGEFLDGWPVGTWRAWFQDGKRDWEGAYEPDESNPDGNYHPFVSRRAGLRAGAGFEWVPERFGRTYGPVWGRRTGTWVRWHPSGAVESEFHYLGGVKHGPSMMGHSNGQRQSQGSYDAGEQEGPWITWYENGRKKSEGSYRAGERASLWITWNRDGSKATEVRYHAAKRQGHSVRWYPNGKKRSEGDFVDGKQEGRQAVWNADALREGEAYGGGIKKGVWTDWYPTGEKAAEETWDGIAKGWRWESSREGPSRLWHRNGQLKEEGSYRGGKRHGRWAAWYESGQPLYEAHWVDGKKHGPWSFWSHDGRLIERASWVDGEPHGLWTRWHRTGNKRSESAYIQSKADGPWRVWYANGQLAEEGTHAKGQRVGLWRYWYPDGTLEAEGRNDAGRRTGRWVRYRQDGQKEQEGDYKDGERDGIWTEWRDDGKRTETIETVWVRGRSVERTVHPTGDSPSAGSASLLDVLRAGMGPIPARSLDCPEGARGYEERSVDGAKARGCVDRKGEKHGTWVGWDDEDRKSFEREYQHGGKVGTWREWHTSGVLWREVHYDESGRKMRWASWNYEGQMLFCGETQPDGHRQRVTEFDPTSGLRKSLTESDNEFSKHGTHVAWQTNGFKRWEGRYFENQKEGLWLTWKADGRLIRATEYRRGKEVGRIDY